MNESAIARSPLGTRFRQAVPFALGAHWTQLRKGSSVPYAAHLLGVCAIVLDHGGSEDEAIAALLHDAAEDRGGWPMLKEIGARFGRRVAAIVDGCTDTYVRPKPDWPSRKQAWLARLARSSRSVKLVAAADKLHNLRATVADLRSAGRGAMGKFGATPEQQVWYYEACLDAVGGEIPGALRCALTTACGEFRALLGDARTAEGTQRPLDLRRSH